MSSGRLARHRDRWKHSCRFESRTARRITHNRVWQDGPTARLSPHRDPTRFTRSDGRVVEMPAASRELGRHQLRSGRSLHGALGCSFETYRATGGHRRGGRYVRLGNPIILERRCRSCVAVGDQATSQARTVKPSVSSFEFGFARLATFAGAFHGKNHLPVQASSGSQPGGI